MSQWKNLIPITIVRPPRGMRQRRPCIIIVHVVGRVVVIVDTHGSRAAMLATVVPCLSANLLQYFILKKYILNSALLSRVESNHDH